MRRRLFAFCLALAAGVVFTGGAAALEVGQKAPEVTLTAAGNKPVKLSELTARQPVVMYTLVQAFTAT